LSQKVATQLRTRFRLHEVHVYLISIEPIKSRPSVRPTNTS